MNEDQRQLIASLGVDLRTEEPLTEDVTLYRIAGGQAAVKLWRNLRMRADQLGAWPIICGNCDELDYLKEAAELGREVSVQETLSRVPAGRPLDALRASQEAERKRMQAWLAENHPAPELLWNLEEAAEETRTADATEWPAEPVARTREPFSVFDLEHKPCECLLAMVPTLDVSAAPAYLNFGGFNGCPPAELHVAFLRDWHRRFGAVPICITHDVIELFVPNPPMTKAAALELAREHETYAPDIVGQGTETVGQLAIELWQSPYWFFWWD